MEWKQRAGARRRSPAAARRPAARPPGCPRARSSPTADRLRSDAVHPTPLRTGADTQQVLASVVRTARQRDLEPPLLIALRDAEVNDSSSGPGSVPLLVSDGVDRLEPGRPGRRIDGEHEPHYRRDAEGEHDGDERNAGAPRRTRRDRMRRGDAPDDPDNAPGHRHQQVLDISDELERRFRRKWNTDFGGSGTSIPGSGTWIPEEVEHRFLGS